MQVWPLISEKSMCVLTHKLLGDTCSSTFKSSLLLTPIRNYSQKALFKKTYNWCSIIPLHPYFLFFIYFLSAVCWKIPFLLLLKLSLSNHRNKKVRIRKFLMELAECHEQGKWRALPALLQGAQTAAANKLQPQSTCGTDNVPSTVWVHLRACCSRKSSPQWWHWVGIRKGIHQVKSAACQGT